MAFSPRISILHEFFCGWQLSAGSYGLAAPPAYGFIHEEECPVGIDENFATIVTGLALAVAAAAVLAAVAIRFPPGGRKKRRRDFGGPEAGSLEGLALSVSKSKSRARRNLRIVSAFATVQQSAFMVAFVLPLNLKILLVNV